MLLILRNAVLSGESIDSIVSAEFPDPAVRPALHAAVLQFMMHGPCDNRPNLGCRKQKSDGSCCREYPKPLLSSTRILDNSFPLYRRRGVHSGLIGDRIVSDEWIVPHNPYLLERYQCHINCEIAGHIRSCKYVYKYCFKAPDYCHVAVNEIDVFLSGRLLSCAEAVFRILGLRLHQEWPPVQRLDIHLPRQHSVVFNPCDDEDVISSQLLDSTSKLLSWFTLNQQDVSARQWRYVDIPEHFVWDVPARQWRARGNRRFSLGRMPSVSYNNLELHALRMLLHSARGARSFIDLRTIDGHIYNSFHDAATAAGMMEDNGEAIAIFTQMVGCQISVASLRSQFCSLLAHCGPSNPMELFNMFAADLMYEELTDISCRNTLQELDVIMRQCYGKSLRDPEFGFVWDSDDVDDVMLPAILDVDPNLALLERLRPLLSSEQLAAVVTVTASVCFAAGFNVFAALCSAGTGKTLFANFLACSLRAVGRAVVCVAASALAAALLEGGHSSQ
jgi:PIF1-like helicase